MGVGLKLRRGRRLDLATPTPTELSVPGGRILRSVTPLTGLSVYRQSASSFVPVPVPVPDPESRRIMPIGPTAKRTSRSVSSADSPALAFSPSLPLDQIGRTGLRACDSWAPEAAEFPTTENGQERNRRGLEGRKDGRTEGRHAREDRPSHPRPPGLPPLTPPASAPPAPGRGGAPRCRGGRCPR